NRLRQHHVQHFMKRPDIAGRNGLRLSRNKLAHLLPGNGIQPAVTKSRYEVMLNPTASLNFFSCLEFDLSLLG
ncbi:MAG: hypothetical protein WBX49_04135, partial [Candidatus Deferrimicrobiaceae bacterium]